jgi:hypothetical protein
MMKFLIALFLFLFASMPPCFAAQQIIVYRPRRGIIRHSYTLSGRANVFEATVSYKLVNKAGKTVHSGYTTASCGTGCWGYFRKYVVVPKAVPAGYHTLYVYEASAKDGSMRNVIKVWPLYMTRF